MPGFARSCSSCTDRAIVHCSAMIKSGRARLESHDVSPRALGGLESAAPPLRWLTASWAGFRLPVIASPGEDGKEKAARAVTFWR